MDWKKLLLAATVAAATLLTAFFAVWSGEGWEKRGLKRTWTVEADFPWFDREEMDEAIGVWLSRRIESGMDETREFASPSDPEFTWGMHIGYAMTKCADRIVSVVFTSTIDVAGAAHPSYAVDALSFALPRGEPVAFDDLFADPEGALAVFAEKSPGLVAGAYAEKGISRDEIVTMMAEYDGIFGDGFAPVREMYSAWAVEEEGMRLYFQPYQILPYSFGIADVLVPLEDLKTAGPNPRFWPGEP